MSCIAPQVSSAASLIVTYSPPELEEDLAEAMLSVGVTDKTTFMLFSRIIHTGLVDNISFKTLKSPIEKTVRLASMLLKALPHYKLAEVAPSAVHLAWAVNSILSGAGGGGGGGNQRSWSWSAPLVKEFLPHTAVLLDGSLAKSFGTKTFEEAVEQVCCDSNDHGLWPLWTFIIQGYTGIYRVTMVDWALTLVSRPM